jgi:hypothetical protein
MEQTRYATNVVEQTLCDKEQTCYATNVMEQMRGKHALIF